MYVYTQGHSRIAGTGVYLPDQRVTIRELMQEIGSKERFGVSYDWLERVTGIKEKRVTPSGMLPSDMAVAAAKEAMERANLLPKDIDVIVYTGLTRDYLEPATAHIVQAKLKALNALVFDVSNACHGFMNGIHLMDALITTGQATNGLVVTGEQGSLLTQKTIKNLTKAEERTEFLSLATGLTLGDAGAAMVMSPKTVPGHGIMGLMLQSQGQHANLCTAGDPLAEGPWFANMTGMVAEGAKLISTMFKELMYKRLKWDIEELAKCFIHQIGIRGLFKVHRLVGIPMDIMPKTVDVLGNVLSANIPLALHHSVVSGEVKTGDKLYLSGGGSGISLSQAGLIWEGS